jgi:predicted ester cyclase
VERDAPTRERLRKEEISMSAENEALVRRYVEEVCDQRKLEVVDEIFASNFTLHDPDYPGGEIGREGIKRIVQTFVGAFPDLQITLEDELSSAEKVVTRWTTRGTHQGELMGIVPTGNPIEVTAVGIWRVAEGKIAEAWLVFDAFGMMPQLGVVEADWSDWHPGMGDPLSPPGFRPLAPKPNSPYYMERHPTRYQWRDDIEELIRRTYREFGGPKNIHINTYLCHPESRDPYFACRDTVSFDIWGPAGRNDPIVPSRGNDIFWRLFNDLEKPDILWCIWNKQWWWRKNDFFEPYGDDDFTWHKDHIHVTYMGPYKQLL